MENRYYYDCEFLEGNQERPLILKGRTGNWLIGYPKPTIDLISIGIVSDDIEYYGGIDACNQDSKSLIHIYKRPREYYAISKDFNLKEAWNRFDLKPDIVNGGMKKVYWIRENVLRPIFNQYGYGSKSDNPDKFFTIKGMQIILNSIGKSNKQIAEEVKAFVHHTGWKVDPPVHAHKLKEKGEIKFYGYYSAYDHVALSWLFGKMIDLPNGFPMYTIDLKQMMDEIQSRPVIGRYKDFQDLKNHPNYPKQTNEHNALSDARFNKELYQFLNKL